MTYEDTKVKWSRLKISSTRKPDNNGNCICNINGSDGHGENGVDGLFTGKYEETKGKSP